MKYHEISEFSTIKLSSRLNVIDILENAGERKSLNGYLTGSTSTMCTASSKTARSGRKTSTIVRGGASPPTRRPPKESSRGRGHGLPKG